MILDPKRFICTVCMLGCVGVVPVFAGLCQHSCLSPSLKASNEFDKNVPSSVFVSDPFYGNMDETLLSSWNTSHLKGETAYPLDVVTHRQCGKYNLILNPKRSARTPPMESKALSVAFNEDRFNFTRADTAETLFSDLVYAGMKCDIVINKFFIAANHFLFLPERYSKHRQFIFPRAVSAVCEFLASSNRDDLVLGYNSVGAFASVNHLHIQGMYLDHAPAVLNANVQDVGISADGVNVAISKDWPVDFIRFSSTSPAALSAKLSKTIADVQKMGVPHNVVFARKNNQLTAFVFVRDFQEVTLGVGTAFLECSGNVVMSDADSFNAMDEENVSRLLAMSRHQQAGKIIASLFGRVLEDEFFASSVEKDAFISA